MLINFIINQLRGFWHYYIREFTSQKLQRNFIYTLVLSKFCPRQIREAQSIHTVGKRGLFVEFTAPKYNDVSFVLDHRVVIPSLRGFSLGLYLQIVFTNPFHFHSLVFPQLCFLSTSYIRLFLSFL